jgi:ABC-type enterochelin transport system ATPase subunit
MKHSLAGASVTLGGVTDTTKSGGVTSPITLTGAGKETLMVSKAGYVRTEATISVS